MVGKRGRKGTKRIRRDDRHATCEPRRFYKRGGHEAVAGHRSTGASQPLVPGGNAWGTQSTRKKTLVHGTRWELDSKGRTFNWRCPPSCKGSSSLQKEPNVGTKRSEVNSTSGSIWAGLPQVGRSAFEGVFGWRFGMVEISTFRPRFCGEFMEPAPGGGSQTINSHVLGAVTGGMIS